VQAELQEGDQQLSLSALGLTMTSYCPGGKSLVFSQKHEALSIQVKGCHVLHGEVAAQSPTAQNRMRLTKKHVSSRAPGWLEVVQITGYTGFPVLSLPLTKMKTCAGPRGSLGGPAWHFSKTLRASFTQRDAGELSDDNNQICRWSLQPRRQERRQHHQ